MLWAQAQQHHAACMAAHTLLTLTLTANCHTPPRCPPCRVMYTPASSTLPCHVLQAYDALVKKLRELDALNGISGLLGWDELVSRHRAVFLYRVVAWQLHAVWCQAPAPLVRCRPCPSHPLPFTTPAPTNPTLR